MVLVEPRPEIVPESATSGAAEVHGQPAPPDPPAPTEPSPSAEAARQLQRSRDCAPGQELRQEDHALLDYYGDDVTLSVVRISPSDSLNLRQTPGVHGAVLRKLPFRLEGLRPTGLACRVDGALWLQVEIDSLRGWVNGRHARPTAAFRALDAIDQTPRGRFVAPTLAELGERLRRAIEASAGDGACGKIVVELVGSVERQGTGQLALHFAPCGDDSIAGREYVAAVHLESGHWRIEQLEKREICWRGSTEGLCI